MNDSTKVYNALEDPIEPAFSSNNVPVIFCCDNNYFPHAMTLVASIMAHSSPTRNYDLLLFIDAIDPSRLRIAQQWMQKYPNARLRFINISKMSESLKMESYPTNARLTTAMYFRLLGPEVLTKYRKVVYLDVDIICMDDISDLFDEDLMDYHAGGCEDIFLVYLSRVEFSYMGYWKDHLKMEPGGFYFNSGVIVMNLEKMRADGTIKIVIEKINSIKNLMYFDQDALNAAMVGSVKKLPARWNCYDWFDELMTPLEDQSIFQRIVVPRDAIGCHHYIGKKPWTWDYVGNNADLYWSYASNTPFYTEIWRSLQKDCSLSKMALLYVKYSAQLLNFRIRQILSPTEKRKKYAGRITSLLSKRSAIGRHMWKVRFNKPFEVPNLSKIRLDQRD